MSEASPHFLYVIGTFRSGELHAPVKVGISGNVGSRLKAIQTGSATPLGLFASFSLPSRRIALAAEQSFHAVLKQHRLTGEWFDMEPERAVRLVSIVIQVLLLKAFKGQPPHLIHEALDDTDVPDALRAIGVASPDLRNVL
jgi:hypothetical protein